MRAGSKRGRQAHGPRAVPPYGSVRRATANGCSAEHEGQQEGLRAEREADGGMRAVAVVGSKGKVGKEAVNVVEMQR